MTTEERILKLERRCRLLSLGLCAAVLSGVVAVFTGAKAVDEPLRPEKDIDPFADILITPMNVPSSENDDRQAALTKEAYNAAYAEIRTRYNYWVQGIGDVDGILAAMHRFTLLRAEVEPRPDKQRFAEQELAFAEKIEVQCGTLEFRQNKYQALREIDKGSATSFRISIEREIEQLKKHDGDKSQPQ